MAKRYTFDELLIITAAREINDGDRVILGVGLPTTAGAVAKAMFAPNAVLMMESGIIDIEPLVPPNHIADANVFCPDGKAAVGPMLREVLIGEAMHALGIPTTRALAVVATGEPVYRERPLPGAILANLKKGGGFFTQVFHFQYNAPALPSPDGVPGDTKRFRGALWRCRDSPLR